MPPRSSAGIIQGGAEHGHVSKAAAAAIRGRTFEGEQRRRTRFGIHPAAVWACRTPASGRNWWSGRCSGVRGWQVVESAGPKQIFTPNELPTVAKAFPHGWTRRDFFLARKVEVTNMCNRSAQFSVPAGFFRARGRSRARSSGPVRSSSKRLHRWREQRSYSSGD